MEYTSEEKLFELATRIFCDYLPSTGTFDAVCVFGQTTENDMSMILAAANVQKFGVVNIVAVTGFPGEKREGFEVRGFAALSEKLIEAGARRERIVSFPLSAKFPPCTDAEAVGVVEFAKTQGWRSVIVTVPPLHQFRAVVSTISAAIKYYPELKVYSLPGPALPWTAAVVHSQSAPRARRADQFGSELAKIARYWKKGDHVSPEAVLAYLDQREARDLQDCKY